MVSEDYVRVKGYMRRTPLGKYLKLIRIEHDETAAEMAKKVGLSGPRLSNFETESGRCCIPEGLVDRVCEVYGLDEHRAAQLQIAAEESMRSAKLSVREMEPERRRLAYLFAKTLPAMSAGEVAELTALLEKKGGCRI